MTPIFTIHEGEYLAGDKIERVFSNEGFKVWVPSKDDGIDLLVTNANASRTCKIQVKFSKGYNSRYACINHGGWWNLNPQKITNSSADFWIFVIYHGETRSVNYVTIPTNALINIYSKLNRFAANGNFHTYISITNDNQCWETRTTANEFTIAHGFQNGQCEDIRNLNSYLNEEGWDLIRKHINPMPPL